MKKLDLEEVKRYVSENIDTFHKNRIEKLKELKLHKILKKKNPYLFKAKNIRTPETLVGALMDAFLSSSEEELFGVFLEGLAVFVAETTMNGRKSAAKGIDLEFSSQKIRYLVTVKSGVSWGNSDQHAAMKDNFRLAVKILKQTQPQMHIQPVLGICYGKVRTVDTGLFVKIVGQNFWNLISGNEHLYTDIIEPIGYQAKEHNERYEEEKSVVISLFAREFSDEFCSAGRIDWKKLVVFNSGNLRKELT